MVCTLLSQGAGGGGSGGVEKRKAQQGHQCKACLQTFMVTLTRAELEQHWESKHSKLSLAQCFPDL